MLADLLDVKRDEWRNAVEGYLGNNKLNLVVAPKYARAALEIYGELDKRNTSMWLCWIRKRHPRTSPRYKKGALRGSDCEGVLLKTLYRPAAWKGHQCNTIEELSECRIGITSGCMLYHTFRPAAYQPG